MELWHPNFRPLGLAKLQAARLLAEEERELSEQELPRRLEHLGERLVHQMMRLRWSPLRLGLGSRLS